MDLPQVESVYNDIDFSMKVTRQVFESACADMKVRFVQPMYEALDNANLTLVRILLMRCENMTLRTECIGGHRFSHIDGWGYAYTDGQGCAGGSRGRVCSPGIFVCAPSMTVPSGKNSL
jgi:hypothetical protein